MKHLLKAFWLLIVSSASMAAEEPATDQDHRNKQHRFSLVEPFSAHTLAAGEFKLGLINVDYGILDRWMIGTDFLADAVGAPNIKTKLAIYQGLHHNFGIGLRAAYLDRETILWGGVKDLFEELEARVFSPSVSWTVSLSSRLSLHSHWGGGFGRIRARLSEKGKRRLWESKHPDGDYESRRTDQPDSDDDTAGNQEKTSSSSITDFNRRALLYSSVAGMLADIFQITGEFAREGGNKILLTNRIERSQIEDLKATSFRLTGAQQWIWDNFQIRLGIGLQYVVVNGVDLDGEKIDETGVLPASDIDFYWRF